MNSKKKLFVIGICVLFVGAIVVAQNWKNMKGDEVKKITMQKQITPPAKDGRAKAPTVDGSTVLFDQKEKAVTVGEEFTLVAKIDPVKNKISAIDLGFTYDSKVLKLEEIMQAESFGTVLSPAKIDDKAGTASITLGADLGKSAVTSVSPVVTLKFKALSVGSSDVSFSEYSKAAAEGYADNIITSRINTKIIIN